MYDGGICGGNGSTCDPCYAAANAPTLTVEVAPAVAADGAVYRFYERAGRQRQDLGGLEATRGRLFETPEGIFNSVEPEPECYGHQPCALRRFP